MHLLQELSVETFTEAFEAQNDPTDFNTYLAQAFSKDKLIQEMTDPHTSFHFVSIGNELVGYFKTNVLDAQNELREREGMELERIYVKSSYQGKGIGLKMLSFVEALALEDGKAYLWLGVWEHNTNAIRFYERHGYIKFDTHPYYIGNDENYDDKTWRAQYLEVNNSVCAKQKTLVGPRCARYSCRKSHIERQSQYCKW